MSENRLPILALTMGDAAGVGPEVIAATWGNPEIQAICRPLVIGNPQILQRASQLRASDLTVRVVDSPADLARLPAERGVMDCLPVGSDDVLDVPAGVNDARTGQAAFEAITRATEMALAREIDGVVTAPISKAALHAAGHDYPGHTELLAELCGVEEFAMMLYLPPGVANKSPAGLGVAHVTLHTSMRTALDMLSIEAVVEKCQLADDMMRKLGQPAPRIGVAALNPHAGEGGLFGDEEQTIIAPAVAQANAMGLKATGPLPADTLMIAARDGAFDGVVAMYHDQGHIALKLLAMHAAVNVTLGLPIVRTSVAHGTAFDRAWQGTAETTGMIAAIQTAAKLALQLP
ncbi:4-hydroxythreonine-4-phosphate dehydrogenase PdxA [Aeoliella mucimassa]|uniref:4-hydroxythreonine-4-phosphate dehydrogenase n=1 Tax=Aeoliella mucimassa TaxID=2527972 RepID=A0A518AMC1_9BACT|nr:4-hydroxythreonine-4-phosphate dehydrogenase PdxA [Aeoliella mucimassa]QDU55871.1 4-hydroxythreonine-4-phosphate dehydrogenase [Aeoliella mucimassa]